MGSSQSCATVFLHYCIMYSNESLGCVFNSQYCSNWSQCMLTSDTCRLKPIRKAVRRVAARNRKSIQNNLDARRNATLE